MKHFAFKGHKAIHTHDCAGARQAKTAPHPVDAHEKGYAPCKRCKKKSCLSG